MRGKKEESYSFGNWKSNGTCEPKSSWSAPTKYQWNDVLVLQISITNPWFTSNSICKEFPISLFQSNWHLQFQQLSEKSNPNSSKKIHKFHSKNRMSTPTTISSFAARQRINAKGSVKEAAQTTTKHKESGEITTKKKGRERLPVAGRIPRGGAAWRSAVRLDIRRWCWWGRSRTTWKDRHRLCRPSRTLESPHRNRPLSDRETAFFIGCTTLKSHAVASNGAGPRAVVWVPLEIIYFNKMSGHSRDLRSSSCIPQEKCIHPYRCSHMK